MENTNKRHSYPFEIVIRTLDEDCVKHGGPREEVIPCKGYFLHTTQEDHSANHGQGEINPPVILKDLAEQLDNPFLFLAAASGLFDD